MPVSKNKRKNQKTLNLRNQKRVERAKKLNSGAAVIGKALSQFNVIRNNVRKLASMYVVLTKNIPGYQESDPKVMEGLLVAIPALKEVNAQYDLIAAEAAEITKSKPKDDLAYFPVMSKFEGMYFNFSENFISNFMPVIEAIERLGENKGADLKLIGETREALEVFKPKFETKVD